MACLYQWTDGEYYTEEQLEQLFNAAPSESMLSIQGTESSKASSKTLAKVQEFLKRIGVEVRNLDTKRYGGVNGVAQLLENVIQVAEGKDDVALPEEAMHFAVEIIKNTDGKLYKALLNKIGSYNMYKKVLQEYGQDKNYLNADGSQNIVKLKEEAVGKLLAEYYIHREEYQTEKPELMSQTQGFLEWIKEFFLSLINKNFNPFEQAVSQLDTLAENQSAKNVIDQINLDNLPGVFGPILKQYKFEGNYQPIISFLKDQLGDSRSYQQTLDSVLSGDESLAQEILSKDFYQMGQSAKDTSIKELDNFLLDLMKDFGVKSKEFDELKSRLGVDALGATDVMNKLIWIVKNRNEETVPEEVGHMAVMLMGQNHPDIKQLLVEIDNWDEFSSIKAQYDPIYKNDKQVRIEAIGKLIAKSLVKQYKANGLNQTLLQRALANLRAAISKLLSSTNFSDIFQYSNKLADHIALNLLMGNKDYIASLKPTNEKLNYKKALDNNPFAQGIISTFTKLKAKLTGSLAIAGQRGSIYRSSEEPIHDIDFQVNSYEDFTEIEREVKRLGGVPAHFGWDNKQKDYKTFAYILPREGYTIEVTERDYERGNGWASEYKVLKNGIEVEKTSSNHVTTDFFVYKNGEIANTQSIFKSINSIYFGKLTLSKDGNAERLFQREKDQTDYVLSDAISVGESMSQFVYYQLPKNENVDKIYNKFIEENQKMVLLGQGTDDRHYTYEGQRVAKTVTSKHAEDSKKFAPRTPEEKIQDDSKTQWGVEGHDFQEDYFKTLIDAQGYKITNPVDVEIVTQLPKSVQDGLKSYLKELINSYPEGTRFLAESKVVNTKEKGMLASTMDFIAIAPNPETGVKVDILDWKFTSINKDITDDIPWFKSDKWKLQMGEYVTIAKLYGVKPNQIGKARMIPFVTAFKKDNPKDPKSGYTLKSLEIGSPDGKSDKLYLIPVPVNSESTGNANVDRLIQGLRAQHKKLVSKYSGEEDRLSKQTQLNELARAIRLLHAQNNFTPLYSEAKTFQNVSKRVLDKFEELDFSTMSIEELNLKLGELIDISNSAKIYEDVDDVYLSAYPKETLDTEGLKLLRQFESLAQSTERLQKEIHQIQVKATTALAIKQGTIESGTLEEGQAKILSAEKEIKGLSKSFLEASKLPNRIIRLAANILLNKKSAQYQEEVKLVNQFNAILPAFLEATKGYKNPLDAIRNMNTTDLKMIPKVAKEFYDLMAKAIETKDTQFFRDNVDMAEYKKLIDKKIENEIALINDSTHSDDPQVNEEQKLRKIKNIKNMLDLESPDFNGHSDKTFRYYFFKTFNRDKHLSKEYQEMAKNPALLAVWNFYTSLNERGKESGYINKQGLSFLPLINSTYLERISNAKNIGKGTIDYLKEGYILDVNEKLDYAQTDEETGEVVKRIPKYFTRTDKATEQLSMDITKITAPWISALLSYETAQNIENVMLTLHEVEQAKGHLQLDPVNKNQVIFKNSEPQVFEGNEQNAALLEKLYDDAVYGVREDSNTLFDTALSKTASGTEEEKKTKTLQGKKVLQGSNSWVQSLATGAKLMVAIPNYVGNQMQGIINAGHFYTGKEYAKNFTAITSSLAKATNIDKALIDMIHPLNEDVTQENTRKLAATRSTLSYLSTWSFADALQSLNRVGDLAHGWANAKTMNENSMVVDGKIVNIRQYVRKQDVSKYSKSFEERKTLEKTYEARVKELKDTRSLPKIAKFNSEGVLEIPGVSQEELARYRTMVVENGRNISGQMSRDNRADYTRDTMFRSFMMFKNWIPKQISVRALDIQKNNELGTWEYGRTRLFAKVISHIGFRRIAEMRDIIIGNENGLKIMDEILAEKRETYYKATGQVLEITPEEFYDMVRKELHSQSKELTFLLGVIGMMLAAAAAAPDDDDDKLTQNRYKWWRKVTNKIADEVKFYYDPTSADSITRGSILPSLSLLNKMKKFLVAFEEEGRGRLIGDEELVEDKKPLKYFLNLVPGPAQFQNEVLPYICPDCATEMGIKVSAEARQAN